MVDTNCDPDGIKYPIPGNDDAARAITLYCDLISRAVIDGLSESQGSLGVDIGEAETVPDDVLAEVEEAAAPEGEAAPEPAADAEPAADKVPPQTGDAGAQPAGTA